MKKLYQIFVPIVLFIFLFTLNSYSQIINSETTLTGHVYAASESEPDTSHSAIANALVSLHSFIVIGGNKLGDSILYQSTTDANGKFEMNNVLPGRYLLSASAQGFETLIINGFEVARDKDTDNVNLFLHDTVKVEAGMISGQVTLQSSGGGVSHAIIEFIDLAKTHLNVFTTTNADGKYSAKLPAGQYYVSCSVIISDSISFFQEFYPDAKTIADAKAVTVMSGQTTGGINFDIPVSVTNKHTVTFKGSVQSSLNTPLANAKIRIWAAEEHDEDDRELIATTSTDLLGNYSITLSSILPRENTFIVAASKAGYKVQFYNGENTFFQADPLFAFSDTAFTNINFKLSPVDTVLKLSISGTVTDSTNTGIANAMVVVFDSASGQVRLAMTDSTGKYTANGLVSGSYYLLFYAAGYFPQFYMNADKWEDATVIRLTASVTGINVTLKSVHAIAANGELVGQIHSDDGTAIAGALITVQTSDGFEVGSAISDANGAYAITGLVQGNLTVTASIAQYSSQQQTTNYDPSSGSTDVTNFSMAKSTVTAVSEPTTSSLPTAYELKNNYPNPFNPSTIISFDLPVNSHVRLEIFNILGQKVAELVNRQMTAGSYSVSFDASKFSSGVYLYRIEAGNFTSTKKMVLTK